MYHAVAGTILANSLMRSQDFVDSSKVGLTGISWGGVITSTVIGIDPRFAFAIPIYGVGDMANADSYWGPILTNNDQYKTVWDPMVRIDKVNIPTLWLSWPVDFHFPLVQQAVNYRGAPGPHMVSSISGLNHSHGAGWNTQESYVFADKIINDGGLWSEQTRITNNDGNALIWFNSSALLNAATLNYTTGTERSSDRAWETTDAVLSNAGSNRWHVSASIPENATAWYVNITDGVTIGSSSYQENTSGKDISPFTKINGGSWFNASKVDAQVGDTIEIGYSPTEDGASWSWTGPNGFSSTSRLVLITTNANGSTAGDYIVTHTDKNGVITRDTITLNL